LSNEFVNYYTGAGYCLEEPAAYGATIEEAGFLEVQAQDMTPAFIALMQRELASIRSSAGEPEDDLDQADRDYLAARWERKIQWCADGEMKWAHLRALRP
ncbi:MAG: phosphoethanolamine N-methyltransferase, partial [Candidatus Hydrogenedentes bacterium]|nr:phosphoethanolamine N-methyltransferase [Candidatus Hydrogenedentota bacterium]